MPSTELRYATQGAALSAYHVGEITRGEYAAALDAIRVHNEQADPPDPPDLDDFSTVQDAYDAYDDLRITHARFVEISREIEQRERDDLARREAEYGGCSCHACRDAVGLPLYCRDCRCEIDIADSNRYNERCYGCFDEQDDDTDEDGDTGNAFVRDYSYTPALNFLRTDDDPDQRLFMGFELEVPCDNAMAEEIYNGVGDREGLLYCKKDGSISGVEIVSHPMTHKWFREHFPFHMFDAKGPYSRYMDTRTPGEGYGLHVHVSRNAFRNEAHVLRWLLLIYRNPEAMVKLARRESDAWGTLKDTDKIVGKAKGDRYSSARYSAVNATNDATFEVRLFRSTWDVNEFRACIDFVHASVTYTRTVSAAEAVRGGLTWRAFRAWLKDREEYAALAAVLRRNASRKRAA